MTPKSKSGLFTTALALVCICVMATLSGCRRNGEYPGQFITIDNTRWEYGDTLTFNQSRDTIADDVIEVELALRHTEDYPYANLWVELSYLTGDTIEVDTFNIRMADDFGRWYGKGARPVVTLVDTLALNALPTPDTYFKLRHIMRVDALTDIEQIGLRPLSSPVPLNLNINTQDTDLQFDEDDE